jgi:hypothetical protein
LKRAPNPRPNDRVVVDQTDGSRAFACTFRKRLAFACLRRLFSHDLRLLFGRIPRRRESKQIVRCLESSQLGDSGACGPTDTEQVLREAEVLHHPSQDEELSILAWRIAVLDRAGYDEGDAVLLAAVREVDLHLAVDLLERGCTTDTALRILL